jgi:hypothetical protein
MSAFRHYQNKNPMVWEQFKATTFEAIKRGFKTYGSKGIFEIMRWTQKGNIKEDGFKLNNNYTSDYARKFMLEYPQHKGFFKVRQLKK